MNNNATRRGRRARVLSVGQCGFDGPNIQRILTENFDAVVETACDTNAAWNAVRDKAYELVLVNRIFDGNGESGLDLIKRLQSNSDTKGIPVMLVSNYADAQQSAVELGAMPGFGKNALNAPQTLACIASALGEVPTQEKAGS